MNQITLLSQDTIDKIAAGEVVERPASIVKELVENAVDAGANAVTVEIRDGGISLIRITDNGSGIPKDQVPVAFLRHATSKIRTVDDLLTSGTLGFRGEALSSIAAVCQVEMITKTAGSITGVRYVIEGGAEKSLEEIGAPEGTTFLVRNLFYHTPARKKFLKTAATEAGYVSDLLERMALSHPEISFKFIQNGDTKLHTSGNCNLKDIVYGIYGRDIASNVIRIETEHKNGIQISGFIGKPAISRGNRNYENYFVNGRYVKSAIVARAIEDAYKPFMMNHRYPFTVLMVQIDAQQVDVNVHPTKMEVRFASQTDVYDRVYQTVKDALAGKELIPEFTVEAPKQTGAPEGDILKRTAEPGKLPQKTELNKSLEAERRKKVTYPEPFEKIRSQLIAEANSPYEPKYPRREGAFRPVTGNIGYPVPGGPDNQVKTADTEAQRNNSNAQQIPEKGAVQSDHPSAQEISGNAAVQQEHLNVTTNAKAQQEYPDGQPHQMELFEDRLLDAKNRKRHKLIGQVFDTYWLVEFDEKLFIIDQHAAHEKVYYERFMEKYRNRQQTTQMVTPPVIVTLTLQEETVLNQHKSCFEEAGFVIEQFGGRDYAISGVPGNLYGIADRTLFTEILDGLMDVGGRTSPESVLEKIASMSCKAAVKGNNRLSIQEADHLIGELLTLENPYNCPHGRPTIISMTKYELEKKFKRIV